MDLVKMYKDGDMTTKLIFINSAVFLLVCLAQFIEMSFHIALHAKCIEWFALNASFSLCSIWQWFTYMFLHDSFIHFIINMLMLSFAGRLFYEFWGSRDLLGVYILGGVFGAVSFIIISLVESGMTMGALCGASASIFALMMACAVYAPNYELRLTLIGEVKLKWVVLVFLAISVFNMFGVNWAGEISHIGGALAGCLFAYLYKAKGINIISKIYGKGEMLKRKPRMKVYVNSERKSNYTRPNFSILTADEKLDQILDKIKKSGYDSLSPAERKFLDDYGRS